MTMILTVDPGETTGFGRSSTLETDEKKTFEFDQLPFALFNDWAHRFIASQYRGHLIVIAERFVIMKGTTRKSRGDVNWSIETIGVLRHLCEFYGHTFALQNASDAFELGTDHTLQRSGFWISGKEHARDAARHMLLWLSKNRKDIFWELIK